MGGQTEKAEEHLLCLLPFPESDATRAVIKQLQEKHPNIRVTWRTIMVKRGNIANFDDVPEEIFHDATILYTHSCLPSPALAKNLKFIHFNTAGINHIENNPIYADTDIKLSTSSGIHGPAISEWVIMQILANSRQQKLLLKWQQKHEWGTYFSLMDVKDSVGVRLGVLGYGSIGRQTARVCKAMGMDVVAYTASPRDRPESRKDNGYIPEGTGDPDGSIPTAWYSGLDKASVHNFLSQDIDVLLISMPLTKETKHFLAEEEFKILGSKRNAFIVNISRGSIINQADLVKYCKLSAREGGLRGAAIDVTDPEPLDEDDEIWDIPNIAITPHISGWSTAFQTRSFEILTRNIENLEAGRPLVNQVDRNKGY